MDDEIKKWYLLQSKRQMQNEAVFNLESQGYECYCPKVSCTRLVKGSKATKIEPLFPSYIFIRLKDECNWLSIASTRGVSKFVRFGMYPTVVPGQAIELIRRNIEKHRELYKSNVTLRAGDIVRINGNGFEEFEGVFKDNLGNNRSIILIKCLHRFHEVRVKTEFVRRVGQPVSAFGG